MILLSRRAVLRGTAALAATLGLTASQDVAWLASDDIEWPPSLPRQVLDCAEVRAAGRLFADGRQHCSAAAAEPGQCRVVAGWVLSETDLHAIGRSLRGRLDA